MCRKRKLIHFLVFFSFFFLKVCFFRCLFFYLSKTKHSYFGLFFENRNGDVTLREKFSLGAFRGLHNVSTLRFYQLFLENSISNVFSPRMREIGVQSTVRKTDIVNKSLKHMSEKFSSETKPPKQTREKQANKHTSKQRYSREHSSCRGMLFNYSFTAYNPCLKFK